MKTRRTIKGTSAEGLVEEAYTPSNPPPYPVTSVAGRTGAVTLSKTDVGLSNVDNTSDTNKPVSTAQATAIAEAKQVGTNAQNAIDTHAAKVNNPHNVTAAQVGAYVKPAEGIPESDLSAEVQGKLNSAGGDTTNATNLIPDENGAVNPGGRGEGTVGKNSTALGKDASAAGTYSTALGRRASAGMTSSTALGNGASASGTSSTALGNGAYASGQYSTALGYGAKAAMSDSNVMQLGGTTLSALRCPVNLTVTSDERDKADINNITNALPFIDKLNPVTFVSNDRVNYISEEDKQSENYRKYGMCDYDRVAHAAGTKKGERRRCGLLAQEVVAAMQEVYGTDNYANIVNDNFHDLQEKPTDVENRYTLAYANLVPFLIGAIKELNAKIKILEDKNNV